MAASFSRTLRSLHADSFTFSLAMMVVSVILFFSWCLWFFRTEVPIYRTSSSARLIAEEKVSVRFSEKTFREEKKWGKTVEAEFPAQAMSLIRPGQKAAFYPDGEAGKKFGPVQAVVSSVGTMGDKSRGNIRLTAFFTEKNHMVARPGLNGKVRVAVEISTPFRLIINASGL